MMALLPKYYFFNCLRDYSVYNCKKIPEARRRPWNFFSVDLELKNLPEWEGSRCREL